MADEQGKIQRLFEECVEFHGHRCPGLAIGLRMTLAAMASLDVGRADDEQLVAVVENDACGVDALQLVAGCSFGKGNLIFRDVGKSVYTVWSRRTGDGVRVSFHGRGLEHRELETREERMDAILAAPTDVLISIQPVEGPPPDRARIHGSVRCEQCGETMMDTRTRQIEGRTLCIPCAEDLGQP